MCGSFITALSIFEIPYIRLLDFVLRIVWEGFACTALYAPYIRLGDSDVEGCIVYG